MENLKHLIKKIFIYTMWYTIFMADNIPVIILRQR